MPKVLSPDQVRRYKRDGHLSPMRVLPALEMEKLRQDLLASEAERGRQLTYDEKLKPYLLFPWADAIVHSSAVLDAVEDAIGPNILVYMTTMWIKEPGTDAVVNWHQDGPYFQLEPTEQITAWVAMSDASEQAGCLRVIPGSHLKGEVPHADHAAPNYLIRRGFSVDPALYSPNDGVTMPLKQGEMSFHNTLTLHASGLNRSNHRRIGMGISYIPTHVRPLGSDIKPPAMLVRGVDEYGYYEPETRYTPGDDAANARNHAWALDLYSRRQKVTSGKVVV